MVVFRNMSDFRVVPFHVSYIPKPQDEFERPVDNSNQPFEHDLERSADGTKFVHPLEKFPESDFFDKDVGCIVPVEPLPVKNTPFKLVEDFTELKLLAEKLTLVDEFAVDLEHNSFRSFQGLTCLMQISTRGEDYIVDTLKLRSHVGPQLREVFKDPDKKKVMHGADKDVLWLQRDFGIYICNLFDTHQASRALKLQKNSLEFLLLHFCGVTVNKAYQNSDWRLRPLPDDMIRYARDDTHYLLYVHDCVRNKLGDRDLLQVYCESYKLCKTLYEKLFNHTSYLYIYGIDECNFNCEQLAVLSGIYEWRDCVARDRDESTGYILPNRAVLDIATRIPLTVHELQECLDRSSHNVQSDLFDSIVQLINTSTKRASSFVNAVQFLKKKSLTRVKYGQARDGDMVVEGNRSVPVPSILPSGETMKIQDGNKLNPQSEGFTVSEQGRCIITNNGNPDLTNSFPRTVEMLDPPSNDSRLGSSTPISQLETHLEVIEQKYERVDNGEEGIEMKGERTNCPSASEHVKEDISCQQKRSNSVEEGSRTSIEETGVKIMKGETTYCLSASVHVNEEVSCQQKRSDSVEDSSRMSTKETDSVEDGSRMSSGEIKCSTSEQETTECRQGSSGEVEERTEGVNSSDSLKEICTNSEKSFSGAIEEVVNNSIQDCRRETLTLNSEIDTSSNVTEQKYERVDNGEEGIEMKREITNCLSASEHVKEDISCQQKRSNSVEEGSRTSIEENGVKIMKEEAFVHVNEEVSWLQNRSDSVEDSSRMSDVETDSVEDSSRMSNEEFQRSTSEKESTECSSSQGSPGEVEEIRTEEVCSSNSLKEICTNSDKSVCTRTISGATEEVVNNRNQGFRMESLITNSEIDSSSNGNKERMNSSNGIEGTKNEGTASTIRSYFQLQPFNKSTVLSYFQLKPVGAYTVSEAECSIYISIFCERVTPARILECPL